MLNTASIKNAVLDRILNLLAPLFLSVVADDLAAARAAAWDMLASYGPRTNREMRHAALAIAFSFGALDALSRSADAELTLNQVLRLRGNANALNRAAEQSESRLDKLSRQPAAETSTELPAGGETGDLVAFARSNSDVPELSRQQRRFTERREEKQRRRQQEAERLEERAARRLAEKTAAANLSASRARPQTAQSASGGHE
jgi:hypothetical protein